MATIRTAIQINDMMSQQFRAMNMAMSTVIDSFEKLQDVSGDAIDTTALNAAQRELQQIEAGYNQVEKEIRQAEQAQHRLNNAINKGEMETWGMVAAVGALGGAYVGYLGGGQLIKTSDELANTEARLNMMNDGLQTTAELQDMIMASALRSDASYTAMASNVARLGQNAKEAFTSTQQAVLFAELLNKQFTTAGASVTEIDSATLQLTQALASGVLRGEELNAVFEAAPNIIRTIADYMGVSIGQIRDLAAEGKVTADIVTAAILGSAQEINAQFESMGTTFARQWTDFKNYAILAFEPVTDRLNEIANSQTFQQFMMSTVAAMAVFAQMLLWVLNIGSSVFGFMYNNWDLLGPVILGVAAAVGTLIAMLIGAKMATLAVALAQMVVAATNPFMWIAVAVVLLIGLFYLAIAVINHFAGTNISATGLIVAAYMFMYTTFYNVIAFMLNLILMFAEFWVNVWTNPVYTIKRLFANLANNAIDMATSMIGSFDSAATNLANMFINGANMAISAINGIIDALNMIPGLDIGKVSEISHRTSLVADYSGIKNRINDWVGETPENYWEAPRLEYKSPLDNAMKGYNWGANLFDFSDFEGIDLLKNNTFDDLLTNAAGIENALLDGNGAGKDTAGNTKKLADSVDMAAEDLAYLKDLAERDTINRYTTGNIRVDMKNDNYINNDMDIDGIIDRFAEKLEEAVETVAEGDVGDV